MVLKTTKLIDKMFVYPENMVRNMDRTKGLLFSQSALGTLLEAGMGTTGRLSRHSSTGDARMGRR